MAGGNIPDGRKSDSAFGGTGGGGQRFLCGSQHWAFAGGLSPYPITHSLSSETACGSVSALE